MNIAPVSRAARLVLLAAAGLMNFTCAVVGQLPPNPAASIETGGKLPVISIYDENDPTAPCDLVAILPPGFSGEVTHLDFRGDYVTLTFSSGQILQIPISDFHVDCESSARSHRPAATPSPTRGHCLDQIPALLRDGLWGFSLMKLPRRVMRRARTDFSIWLGPRFPRIAGAGP